MNVEDVATSVKRTFGDEGGIQITDSDIIRWINKAQYKITLDNPGLLETTASSDSVEGQSEYDLPVDCATLHSVQWDNFHLKFYTITDFNNYVDGYNEDTSSGVPQVYYTWENKIRVFPTPSEATVDIIRIFYIKNPPEVATLGDELSLPIAYHNAIEEYCMKKAYELDESPELASFSKAELDEDLMKLKDRNKLGATEQYPMISRSPDLDDGWYPYGI